MTKRTSSALSEINLLLKSNTNNIEFTNELNKIKALCLIAQQANNKAVISKEVKSVLMKDSTISNSKLIFAIARELEFKGNTTDAAILLSKMKTNWDHWPVKGTFWRTKLRHNTLYQDFYDDYFFYLDAQYSSGQISSLLSTIKKNPEDDFYKWLYSDIKKDIPRLYDLLGTKFLRKNNLNKAIKAFSEVGDSLWTSDNYYYKDYLDANPFYTNIYNEHQGTKADTITFNKESITSTLINYLNKANDIKNTDRDYYYFLAANCYFNMTQYGNSWMMKRYFWTVNATKTKLADDDEYFNCILAKKYYLKAKSVSKSEKFSALCLRMAGKCEKYRLKNKFYDEDKYNDLSGEEFSKKVFDSNNYYSQIQKQYPDYYDDLISNCESFDSYFNSRK